MSSSAIVHDAGQLTQKYKELKIESDRLQAEIDNAKAKCEAQRIHAELTAELMKRDELPDETIAKDKLQKLKVQIKRAKKQQTEFKLQSEQIKQKIDLSIEMREKRNQYEQLKAEINSLAQEFDLEDQKRKDLDFRRSQLSSDLLKLQLTKKALDQQISAPLENPPAIAPLQQKGQLLNEQIRSLQNTHDAFQQELEESTAHLESLRKDADAVSIKATQAKSVSEKELKQQILDLAAENLDLRQYKKPTQRILRQIEYMQQISDKANPIIEEANCALDDE